MHKQNFHKFLIILTFETLCLRIVATYRISKLWPANFQTSLKPSGKHGHEIVMLFFEATKKVNDTEGNQIYTLNAMPYY